MPDNTFTTYEIAKICDVYPSSVIHWINGGKLAAYNTPGGHHRVTRDDLLRFLREFKIPIPKELASEGKTVLIVDDDPEVTRFLERAFQRHPAGFKTEVRHKGVDALIRIGQSAPDLIVLDIVLPGMDGCEVCRILKKRSETRGIKIIGISGKKMPFQESRLAECKLDAFFRKPLDAAQLLGKAAELLGAETAPASRPMPAH